MRRRGDIHRAGDERQEGELVDRLVNDWENRFRLGAGGAPKIPDASKLPAGAGKRRGAGFAPVEDFARLTGLDTRLLAMLAALVVIWIVLDLWTGGLFLTPRNLFNLAVQGSAVGIMATGMVFVIVARHIDLSVGSVLGFVGMAMAYLQVEVFALGAGWNWPLSIACGLALGALVGLWQGLWVAYGGVPAFVVTLGGLLIFRGAAFEITDGRTVAPLDPVYQLLGERRRQVRRCGVVPQLPRTVRRQRRRAGGRHQVRATGRVTGGRGRPVRDGLQGGGLASPGRPHAVHRTGGASGGRRGQAAPVVRRPVRRLRAAVAERPCAYSQYQWRPCSGSSSWAAHSECCSRL